MVDVDVGNLHLHLNNAMAVLGVLGIIVTLFWTIKTQMGIAARQRQTARGASTFETYKQVPGRGW